MPPFLESLVKKANKMIKPRSVRVLPEILMQGAINETVQDTVRLGRGWGTVKVQIHNFLVRPGLDRAVVLEVALQVQEMGRSTRAVL
jgi:hypothetical protein